MSIAWLKILSKLPFFSREEIRTLSPNAEKNAEIFLYRNIKNNKIVRLRRGIYTTKEYVDSCKIAGEFSDYLEFLANVIVPSSYITGAYILSKYELLTEAVTTITSLTSLKSELVPSPLGTYTYKHVESKSIGNFDIITSDKYLIKRASKVQALFDYLFLIKKNLAVINSETVKELRINSHLLSKEELENLNTLSKNSGSIKMVKLTNLLKSESNAYK